MIRETITDLRDIINNASSQELSFDEIMADLRVETAERLAASDIELKWVFSTQDTPPLNHQTVHALRSIIREVVSNVIKHSGASNFYISWKWEYDRMTLNLFDDGKGIDEEDVSGRAGLANIEARIEGLNGQFIRLANNPGANFEIQFPINKSEV